MIVALAATAYVVLLMFVLALMRAAASYDRQAERDV